MYAKVPTNIHPWCHVENAWIFCNISYTGLNKKITYEKKKSLVMIYLSKIRTLSPLCRLLNSSHSAFW